MRTPIALVVVAAAGLAAVAAPALAAAPASPAAAAASQRAAVAASPDQLQRALDRVVASGIPGAAVLVTTPSGSRFRSAGAADLRRRRPIAAGDRYRIASMSKAFSAAAALSLVRDRRLGLDDTVEQHLPGLLPYGEKVTLRQLLAHRSGVPDYTASERFARVVGGDMRGLLRPRQLIGFIDGLPLSFAPGSRYRYSNTDNILVGMIVAAVSGRSYEQALARRVLRPLGLRATTLPARVRIRGRHVHGYDVPRRGRPEDVTTALSPSGAWASGGIVSRAGDVGRFFRGVLSGRAYGRRLLRAAKRAARPGQSSPPVPGGTRAGLGLFRYTAPCGVVWGHTGLFPGYRNFAVASADGRRSAVVLVNGTGQGLGAAANRAVVRLQRAAACTALGG